MKKNEFFEYLPNFVKDTKDLTLGSKNVLAALMFLNNKEFSKENGFFYRSNRDLCKDAEVCEHTLIKSLSQLEVMGFIERKVGKRGSGASEYKINNDFLNGLKVDFNKFFGNAVNEERIKVEGFTAKCSKECSNKSAVIENKKCSNQNTDKQRDFEESAVISAVKKCSTDTDIDTEVDIDIINKLNNNIIELNKNLKEIINLIKEKENNKINFIIKEKESEALQTVEVEETEENEILIPIEKENLEDTKEINESVAAGTLSDKETENNIINTSTEMDIKHASTVEITKLYPNAIVEQAVAKQTPSEHYNLITPKEQERIFNELMERFMNSNSLEEVEDKWRKFIKYLNSRTFMIHYIQQAQKAHQELLKKFQPTEESKLSPLSLPNDDGGIVAHPKGENPTDATKDPLDGILFDSSTLEDDVTPTAKSEICSLSPSNDEDGTITQIEEENPTDAKEMPSNQKIYNPLEVVERIKAERMEGLRKAIDDATTVEELRDAAKKVNSLRNSLSTNEMAELAEIMDLKVKSL